METLETLSVSANFVGLNSEKLKKLTKLFKLTFRFFQVSWEPLAAQTLEQILYFFELTPQS